MRDRQLAGAVALLCALQGSPTLGHGLDPALLSLRATGGGETGRYDVIWRTAAQRRPGADVQPLLPAHCQRDDRNETAAATVENDGIVLRWSVDCGERGLTGSTISIRDLDAAGINALLRIEESDGSVAQVVLNSRRPSFAVPPRPSSFDVWRDYVGLGVEHILGGPDHLLFVIGLLLLVAGAGALAKTVTAFTLGHSITLSAAVLGWVNVPSRPIELLIAISVLALAVDLAGRDERTPLRRFPWLMAAGFGLLHGFGFAGALAETGLPAGDIPLALFSFNLGIEVGQLGFVAAALIVAAAGRQLLPDAARLRAPVVYAMGILAAFWSLERAAAWLL